MSNVKTYYAIYDGMNFGSPTDGLVTFVEHKRTKKPLYSGGGNLGFVKLVKKSDYDECNSERLGYKEAEQVAISERNALKSQNDRLIKALSFYADTSQQSEFVCLNGARDSDFGGINLEDFELIEISKREGYAAKHYGKLARQTLADLGIKGVSNE